MLRGPGDGGDYVVKRRDPAVLRRVTTASERNNERIQKHLSKTASADQWQIQLVNVCRQRGRPREERKKDVGRLDPRDTARGGTPSRDHSTSAGRERECAAVS
jgi:hypothetical protein